MFADLLQALGASTSAKWAAQGKVTCGSYCDAQGAMQQLGETGVAMSTLVIAIHTFATVFFRWQPQKYPWLWMVVVACIWTFLLLFLVIGYVMHKGAERRGGMPYFSPVPFWCWIGSGYTAERIAGEYIWVWSSPLISSMLYLILFFRLRGNIDVDPSDWKRISFHRRSRVGIPGKLSSPTGRSQSDLKRIMQEKQRNKEAMKMFWYPISYIILYGPLSISRWMSFSRTSSYTSVEQVSIARTSAVVFIFGLSGLFNVLLFFLTRPNILLFNVRRKLRRERHLQQLSEITPGGVSFPDPRYNYGTSSSFSAPGTHPRTGRRRDDEGEEDWDDGFLEDSQRRSDVESIDWRNFPPPPPQTIPLPPPPTSPAGVPLSGMDRVDGTVEVVRTNHDNPGKESSTMRRMSGGSSGHATATTFTGDTFPAGIERLSPGSRVSASPLREALHDDDVRMSGIRKISIDHRLPTPHSATFPVMPEPPSMFGRHTFLQSETEVTTATFTPPTRRDLLSLCESNASAVAHWPGSIPNSPTDGLPPTRDDAIQSGGNG
ncbi:hypothetical protein M407DRAFT_24856 [Tulasnella calospora MUT 4182]|uniref:Uncharacterized protein n=1 Tax=Tulasnella calospora MUT 4182 TaxID=1051891 RepID=A0A0C3QH58_9AGAM|nr:hypothetical protein M407DRAFT_24856 [Tulasnella calospora MUT 4182]